MKIKLISLLLLCTLLAAALTGCRTEEYSEKEITKYVNKAFKNSELINCSNQKVDGNDTSTSYTYKTEKGVVFDVKSRYYHDSMFGLPVADLSSNYYEALDVLFSDEIENLKTEYNANLSSDWDGPDCAVPSFDEIDKKVDFVFDYYELIKDYLPDTTEDTPLFSAAKDDFEISLSHKDNRLLTVTFNQRFKSMTPDYVKECAKIKYADIYRSKGSGEDFGDLPLLYINNLYINGEKYTSDKYTVEFVYDADSGEYCIPVGYGLKFDYNGGVEDYIQREIVTDYLGGSYSINPDKHTTNYTIGENSYKVTAESDNYKSGKFYINGKKQDISLLDTKLDFWGGTGATYFYYMKLSDYAKMLDMDYSVSQADNAVYLTSKN